MQREEVETPEEIIENIKTFEKYLVYGTEAEIQSTLSLIEKGICFIAYDIEGEIRFIPSKYVGYKNNNIEKHTQEKEDRNGNDTNDAIESILGIEPSNIPELEKLYKQYCNNLGFKPNEKGCFGRERRYWDYFISNQKISDKAYLEGSIFYRMHKQRERNRKVIDDAKQLFINKYGKVFCEACGFDFEREYGKIGKNFIEGHHTIAVKDMKPNHKTVVEDIALLCSNCHSMIHSRKEMLSILELKEILGKNKSKK